MDPVTAVCNAIAALANLEVARLNAMSEPQRQAYLQIGINAAENVSKGWLDFATRVMDFFHPKAA